MECRMKEVSVLGPGKRTWRRWFNENEKALLLEQA
jgi:hypothetical protein